MDLVQLGRMVLAISWGLLCGFIVFQLRIAAVFAIFAVAACVVN